MRGIGSPARTMAINGAMLYGAGAGLVTLFVIFPHSPRTNVPGVMAAGLVTYLVTGLLLMGRDWLPSAIFPTLTAAGTGLITLLAYFDGSRPSAFILLYVWAAVYAFYFYRFSVAVIEAAWIALAAATGQVLTGFAGYPVFLVLMITTTSVMAGLAVRQLVVQVASLADKDSVTGVLSRRKYHIEIEREMARARRSRAPLSLMLLDLDNFKRLNDLEGHVHGDRHLRDVAQAWQRQLRLSDTLARYGGEEFVVILPDTDLENARQAADRLRAIVPRGETASAGVAQWNGTETPTELLGRSDKALYEAKRSGRNATAAFTALEPRAPSGA